VRARRAKERHHSVADMLVDRAPITDNDAVNQRREAAHQLTDLFRIQ
jgi:hypothetical protein